MKKETPAPRRRSPDELRQAILHAATEVFLESGYAGASIDAVIDRVGGSKRAIYSYFGGKKELFEAIVMQVSGRALAALDPDTAVLRDAEATLLDFGMRGLTNVMSPTTIAFYRLVVAEGARFPDLAQAFFAAGPGRASAGLAKALREFDRKGELEVADCQRAAEHFIGMLRDDLHLKVVLGLRPPPGPREIEETVRHAVDIFLDGCRPGDAPRGRPRKPSRARRP
jgi:AcrR family transcriptional regulator